MFEEQVGGPNAATTLSLVAEAHHTVLLNECRLVELAAHWADLHHPDSQAPVEKPLPGAEQGRQLGGDGTPEVLEFAGAEFGARMEVSSGSARALMADALDLRHRLPELWQLIMTGGVPAWKARKVAQATRHLSHDSAMQVDAAVARDSRWTAGPNWRWQARPDDPVRASSEDARPMAGAAARIRSLDLAITESRLLLGH